MDAARTISWVFYALAMASQKEPATFRSISEVADGINHAMPTHKELQTCLAWLLEIGLVLKRGSKYELSEQGLSFDSRATRSAKPTVSSHWDALTAAIGELMVARGTVPT